MHILKKNKQKQTAFPLLELKKVTHDWNASACPSKLIKDFYSSVFLFLYWGAPDYTQAINRHVWSELSNILCQLSVGWFDAFVCLSSVRLLYLLNQLLVSVKGASAAVRHTWSLFIRNTLKSFLGVLCSQRLPWWNYSNCKGGNTESKDQIG